MCEIKRNPAMQCVDERLRQVEFVVVRHEKAGAFARLIARNFHGQKRCLDCLCCCGQERSRQNAGGKHHRRKSVELAAREGGWLLGAKVQHFQAVF